MSSASMIWSKGADVASAAAIPLITDGNYFDVTGTTTITSMASMGVGTWVRLHFDGALTLTHNATDLILPGAANIVTAAGDEAEFIEYASGDWRLVCYQRAAGVSNPLVIGTLNASTGVTSQEHTGIPSWAKEIEITVAGLSWSGTSLPQLQIGDAGGFETSGYGSAASSINSAGNAAVSAVTTSGYILSTTSIHAAASAYSGIIKLSLHDPASNGWAMTGSLSTINSAGTVTINGYKELSDVLTQLRFISNGVETIDSGETNIKYK
jgi:hypothetical protein